MHTNDMSKTPDFPVRLDPEQLITIDGDRLLTSSKAVAEVFGKRHGNILRKIDSLDCSKDFAKHNFVVCFLNNDLQNGKPQKQYQMTKDGFMFLVMGFTGKLAARIKEAYITAFNWMAEKLLTTKNTVPDGQYLASVKNGQISYSHVEDNVIVSKIDNWPGILEDRYFVDSSILASLVSVCTSKLEFRARGAY